MPPPEPSVIEPDRPAHRPKEPAELLGGGMPLNNESTSLSSYLVGTADPAEDYFPYPNGAGDEPGFEKQFMLEPNWYEQFAERFPNPRAETPQLPGPMIDGYSTLYQQIPPLYKIPNEKRNVAPMPGAPTSIPGASTNDPELRRRIDDLFSKMEQLDVSRAENNHSEIILFVMTGIFVLLMLDLLLKQGCRALTTIVRASTVGVSPISGGNGAHFNNPFFM